MLLSAAGQAILHATVAALFVEALLRLWRVEDPGERLAMRWVAIGAPVILTTLYLVLMPWRAAAWFVEHWSLFAGRALEPLPHRRHRPRVGVERRALGARPRPVPARCRAICRRPPRADNAGGRTPRRPRRVRAGPRRARGAPGPRLSSSCHAHRRRRSRRRCCSVRGSTARRLSSRRARSTVSMTARSGPRSPTRWRTSPGATR